MDAMDPSMVVVRATVVINPVVGTAMLHGHGDTAHGRKHARVRPPLTRAQDISITNKTKTCSR